MDKQGMRNRRIAALILLIVGLTFSGMALFADSLGLDDHSGWGRLRTMFFVANILLTLLAALYLLFQKRADRMAIQLLSGIGRNPFISRLLNSAAVVRLSSALQKYSFTLPVMACVILVYIWLISSGTWTTWVSPTRHYATLAQGFERGKLFMTTRPDPRLGALPNPYDPSARRGIQTPVDVTYYQGRYYLYWGPVPSLMLVPVQAILQTRVGDLQLVFFFTCGTFLLLCALVILMWDLHFHELPKWMLGISILLIGTANPTLFMLNNFKGARIYEAAITGGQFFLVGGLLLAVLALGRSSPYWMLAFTGSLWALSIGTRLFLVLPICAMVFVLACSWLGTKQRPIEKAANLLAVGFPLLLGFLALGWYNWQRFGSVTESGLYYQLAGLNLQKNYDILLDTGYFFQNLYNYLIHPFALDTQFPFVRVDYGNITSILPSHSLPPLYTSQQMTGLLPSVPFAVFALIPFAHSLMFKNQNGRTGITLPWAIWILSGSFVAAFVFLMFFFWSAMRYLQDFMPSLLVLSVIGFWQGYKSLAPDSTARKIYAGLGVCLAAISILVSLLLAVSMNDARFEIMQALGLLH
jgi:hypothetical protein